MGKRIFYGSDARRRVLGGAKIVYETVSTTLGPKGRNVVLGAPGRAPIVTHDGITSIKALTLDDIDDHTLGYSVGAELIKSASATMDRVGDGSTTVSVLAYHLMKEADKLIAAGYNPMTLRKSIEDISAELVTLIDKYEEDIAEDSNRVAQIAGISAGDEAIGNMIADVIKRVGAESTVTVEVGQGLEMESEVTEGYTFGRGYASPHMVTDVTTMEAVYKNVPVLVTDAKLTSAADIIPLLELMNKEGKRNLVILADDISGEALGMLVFNKLKGTFNTVVVKAPSFGDRRQQTLDDIAILTGATFISTERGHNVATATLADLGAARQVIVTADNTTIVEGQGVPEDIKTRAAELESLVKTTKNDYDREFHERRLASLDGKVAIIRVGGATETEIEEKKYRVDDAVAAAKAAVRGGIVAGGGVTLVNVARDYLDAAEEDSVAQRIVLNAVEKPFRILMRNAGLNADEYLPQVRAKRGYGVNVRSADKLVDMKKAGIVDPADVTKTALQNATSIAATAITMGALVVDIPTKNEGSATPQMGVA